MREGHREGGFRTLFLAIAVDIVKDYWSEIRACPQCRHWFLRHGKQTFCSPECEAAFYPAFLRKQHAPDIGVPEDRDRRRRGIP